MHTYFGKIINPKKISLLMDKNNYCANTILFKIIENNFEYIRKNCNFCINITFIFKDWNRCKYSCYLHLMIEKSNPYVSVLIFIILLFYIKKSINIEFIVELYSKYKYLYFSLYFELYKSCHLMISLFLLLDPLRLTFWQFEH